MIFSMLKFDNWWLSNWL